MQTDKQSLADYTGKTIQCECGRSHTVDIGTVEISSGALEKVKDIIRKDGFRRPFLVADQNTHRIAGKELLAYLTDADIFCSSYIFEDQELVPNEHALGKLLVNYDPSCDVIIAVGAGTINDISRFMSHRLDIPYYIVATAPSMDGYASTVAPLIKDNLKTTFECQMPLAIIADLDIIANAPSKMIAAGFGDVIGKYTCLADWALSAIINEEYYCERVVNLTRQSLERTIAVREGIARGERDAIGELMEALVLAGIAMSYVGNSRPASGSEHHLSHFWEMRFLFEGKPAILHGLKVGIGAVVVSDLYERLRLEGLNPAEIAKIAPPNNPNWIEDIKQAFMGAADGILELERKTGKNSPVEHQRRIRAIADKWEQIGPVLESVPSSKTIAELLKSVQGPSRPSEVGISQELVQQAIEYGKEIRSRYTILQLLWDLDRLSQYAKTTTREG